MDKHDAQTIYHACYRLRTIDLEAALLAGMIAKKDLEEGATYIGYCRNATEATWHSALNRFTHVRDKFGMKYTEEIHHPEDDVGFDVFVPVQKKEAPDVA